MTADLTAAQERYDATSAAYLDALRSCECSRARDAFREASEEYVRLSTLAQPLRDVLDHQIRHYVWRTPPTARKLAKGAYRPVAEVQAELDAMVAEGIVRQVGNGYEVVAS